MNFKSLNLETKKRTQMLDITNEVDDFVKDFVKNGIVIAFSPHTTAGISINENADPTVQSDMTLFLNNLIPKSENFEHREGNSDAHIKTTICGSSVTIPIVNGKMQLGIWQAIYFCEFDGPRKRHYHLKAICD